MKQSFCKFAAGVREQRAGAEPPEGWMKTSVSSALSCYPFLTAQFPISVLSSVKGNTVRGLTLLLP